MKNLFKSRLSNFFKSKKSLHEEYILNNIFLLHSEILQDVLSYNRTGILPIKTLKHKATLVHKYSRRLKLITM